MEIAKDPAKEGTKTIWNSAHAEKIGTILSTVGSTPGFAEQILMFLQKVKSSSLIKPEQRKFLHAACDYSDNLLTSKDI